MGESKSPRLKGQDSLEERLRGTENVQITKAYKENVKLCKGLNGQEIVLQQGGRMWFDMLCNRGYHRSISTEKDLEDGCTSQWQCRQNM